MVTPTEKTEMLADLDQHLSSRDHRLFNQQLQMLAVTRLFLDIPRYGTFYPYIVESSAMRRRREIRETADAIYETTYEVPQQGALKLGDYCELNGPPGVGKTRSYGHMAIGMSGWQPGMTGKEDRIKKVVILTPRKVLNRQTLREFIHEMDIPPELVGVYDSDRPAHEKRDALEAPILLTTYQGLESHIINNRISANPADGRKHPKLLILDEVHTGCGHDTVDLIQSFFQESIVASFTATDGGAAEKLFWGQPPIYQMGLVPGIENNLLCYGARAGTIDIEVDEDTIQEIIADQARRKGVTISEDAARRYAKNPALIKGIIEAHLRGNDRILGDQLWRYPTVIYTNGVEAAEKGMEDYNRRAQQLGIPARAVFVSGEMSPARRDENMGLFESLGPVDDLYYTTIWNDQMLGLGYDKNDITCLYSGQLLMDSTDPIQQLGRSTRRQGRDADARGGNYYDRFSMDKTVLAKNARLVYRKLNRETGQMELVTPPQYLYANALEGRGEVFSTNIEESRGTHGGDKEPVIIPGLTIRVGENEMQEVLAADMRARQQLFGDRPAHYLSVEQVIEMTGLSAEEVLRRVNEIRPRTFYTMEGLRPEQVNDPNIPTVLGETLVHRERDNGNVEFSFQPEFVGYWVAAVRRDRELASSGKHPTLEEFAAAQGITVAELQEYLKRMEGSPADTKKPEAKSPDTEPSPTPITPAAMPPATNDSNISVQHIGGVSRPEDQELIAKLLNSGTPKPADDKTSPAQEKSGEVKKGAEGEKQGEAKGIPPEMKDGLDERKEEKDKKKK